MDEARQAKMRALVEQLRSRVPLEKAGHAELYQLREKLPRGPEQDEVANAEHRAFAREFSKERPILGPLSLGVAIPAYALVKALRGTNSRSNTGLDQVKAGYAGIGDALFGD